MNLKQIQNLQTMQISQAKIKSFSLNCQITKFKRYVLTEHHNDKGLSDDNVVDVAGVSNVLNANQNRLSLE